MRAFPTYCSVIHHRLRLFTAWLVVSSGHLSVKAFERELVVECFLEFGVLHLPT